VLEECRALGGDRTGRRVAGKVRSVARVRTTDSSVNRGFDQVNQSIQTLATNPLLNGNVVRRVSLSVGVNLVSHGLGRNYITWLAGAPSEALATFGSAPLCDAGLSANPNPALYIAVYSPAACTADFVVL
jgi:hypothetical protein